MTQKKSANNRKKSNKVTVYLPDSARDYLISEARLPGKNRSIIVQEAIALHMHPKSIEEKHP